MVTKVPAMVAQMLGLQDIGGDEHRSGMAIQGAIIGGARTGMQTSMQAGLGPKGPKNDQAGKDQRKQDSENLSKIAEGIGKTGGSAGAGAAAAAATPPNDKLG